MTEQLTLEQKAEIFDWLISIKEGFSVGHPDDAPSDSDEFEIVIKTKTAKAISNRSALDNFIKALWG